MSQHPARSWSGAAGTRATAAAATMAAAVFVAPTAYAAVVAPDTLPASAAMATSVTHAEEAMRAGEALPSAVPVALAVPLAPAAVSPAFSPVPASPAAPIADPSDSLRIMLLNTAPTSPQPRTVAEMLALPAPPAPAAAPPAAAQPAAAPAAPAAASSKGASALAAALSARGTPYRWGGTGKGGFDCSGLALWAYRKAGVNLPRSSRSQSGFGTPVSRADLRPGDLVFFYRPVRHVGIYVGNGQVVHAPQTGDVVKISPIGRMPFAGARRL